VFFVVLFRSFRCSKTYFLQISPTKSGVETVKILAFLTLGIPRLRSQTRTPIHLDLTPFVHSPHKTPIKTKNNAFLNDFLKKMGDFF